MLNIWFRGGENPDGTPIEVIDAIDFYFKYLFTNFVYFLAI